MGRERRERRKVSALKADWGWETGGILGSRWQEMCPGEGKGTGYGLTETFAWKHPQFLNSGSQVIQIDFH